MSDSMECVMKQSTTTAAAAMCRRNLRRQRHGLWTLRTLSLLCRQIRLIRND
eukprot:CAMPEP_0202719832 /NCGR_PEP_ID=MMETSP1385-20130828/134876_1 /ASSEMBLY_ACC=CAM_ASM_000861 /TAXON_ID=933848 /ORGANISM="Elphidium margaritaceum" /LENGTH=51 /DNA_ID=CAMNT_0049383211 /DNA_START=30 /DNA_END=182 /DNA_ORIENTATION=+